MFIQAATKDGCKSLGMDIEGVAASEIFDACDEDGSGELDYWEVEKAIKRAGKYPPPSGSGYDCHLQNAESVNLFIEASLLSRSLFFLESARTLLFNPSIWLLKRLDSVSYLCFSNSSIIY